MTTFLLTHWKYCVLFMQKSCFTIGNGRALLTLHLGHVWRRHGPLHCCSAKHTAVVRWTQLPGRFPRGVNSSHTNVRHACRLCETGVCKKKTNRPDEKSGQLTQTWDKRGEKFPIEHFSPDPQHFTETFRLLEQVERLKRCRCKHKSNAWTHSSVTPYLRSYTEP